MSDEFFIVPYKVRSAGTDVPPEEVQAAINSICQQTTADLNTIVTAGPQGPAGGDLSGTYPNPTVVSTHLTAPLPIAQGGTGQATQSAALTALLGSSVIPVANGGTGSATTPGGLTNLGAGTIATQNANNVAITGGTINNTPIGQTTTAAGSFTTLNSTGGAVNGSVGATTPNTGSFTTLAASSTVSGAGFTARFASPGPIGNTAASTGAFTTLSASGAITPSTTAGIVGTTLGNNANAGSVGEVISNFVLIGSAIGIGSGVASNVTSILLTPGDWDVQGNVALVLGATTTLSFFAGSINITSGAQGTPSSGGAFVYPYTISAGNGNPAGATGVTRLNVTTNTTVFLVATAVFAASTCAIYGSIYARRMR